MFILELEGDAKISRDNDSIEKILWHLKQVSAFPEDNSSIVSIATSVIANEVKKMERKDVCNDSLKCSEKIKTLSTKTSVKLSSKGEATFESDLLFQGLVFWHTVVILTLTIVKDMNCVYIPQRCLNQQQKSKKQRSNL